MSSIQWFSDTYTVPWYVVWIPILLFVLLAVILTQRHIMAQTFRCPNCGRELHVRALEFSAWLHENDDRVIRCSACGRKGFCRRID